MLGRSSALLIFTTRYTLLAIDVDVPSPFKPIGPLAYMSPGLQRPKVACNPLMGGLEKILAKGPRKYKLAYRFV